MSILFMQYARFESGCDVLLSNVEDDRLIRAIAARAGQARVFHHRWDVVSQLRKRLADFQHVTISEAVFPAGDDETAFDAALVGIPRGREFARALLGTALNALKPGAFLFAAGSSKGGAKTALTDAKMLAPARVLGMKNRHRIFSAQRGDTVTIPESWGTPWQRYEMTLTVHSENYRVYTQPGIFSYQHLDSGTAFLLDNLPAVKPGGRILDAGCGYGIVGMVAQRELAPRKVVWADVDLLAVACTRAGVPDGTVIPADLTQESLPDAPFDLVLCNPPFHKEREQSTVFMQSFARQVHTMLSPGGQLVIVANSFLDYRELLETNFSTVTKTADNGSYQVLVSVR